MSDAPPNSSIRAAYERLGSDAFYAQQGAAYRNPHEPIIAASIAEAVRAWPLDLSHVLDLAAGSGEATLALRTAGATRIDGIDPYTADAYLARTGQPAERLTFAQIEAGVLGGRRYSLIVCSFAMHLVEPSRLPALLYQVGQVSDSLLILMPHKRPDIRGEWGWRLEGERIIDRVRTRYYRTASPRPRANAML